MTCRSRILLALLLQAMITASHAADPLLTVLNDCIDSRFVAGEASKINEAFSLDLECHALFVESLDNELLQQFDPPPGSTTSLNQLLDMRFLLARQQLESRADYSLADRGFLQQLQEDHDFESSPVELGLWDRFVKWLKERYRNNQEGEADWGWLIELLEHGSLPGWLTKLIYYVSIGLIVILAIFIVVNELRAARRGGQARRRRQATGSEWQAGLASIDRLDWAEIGRLPRLQQPGAMLRYVIDRLVDRGLVSDNRSRTNREMWRELRVRHNETARRFDHAINLAELAVYGDQPLDDVQLRELYDTAQSLAGDEGDKPA